MKKTKTCTLYSLSKLSPFLCAVIFLISFDGSSALAQDLDIPGLEEEVAPSSSSSSAGASKEEINLWQMVKAGGPTMVVLGFLSFMVIGLVVYGLIDLRKANFVPDSLHSTLMVDMEAGDLESARQKLKPTDDCLSAIMSAGINHVSSKGFEALETEKFEELLGAASQRFNRARARTINYFSIIAQASPMLGLLGTVSGMILAFATLSSSGGGDPSEFADDISMALVTTAGGLVVALPAIFAYFFMRDRLQSLVAMADDAAEELVETLRNTLASYHTHQE